MRYRAPRQRYPVPTRAPWAPRSRVHVLALTRHIRRHRSRLQPIAAAGKSLVHDAARQTPAPDDESGRHPVDEHIAVLDTEIEQRLAAIVIAHKERRQFAAGCEGQSRLDA